MTRRAEAQRTRSWVGDVAARNELDEVRRFVIWGEGYQAPDIDEAYEPRTNADDIAEGIAGDVDPDWWDLPPDRRWVMVLRGDEDDIDELVQELGAAGPAPYIAEGKTDEASKDLMKGTLRSDVAPRRKVDQPRPHE